MYWRGLRPIRQRPITSHTGASLPMKPSRWNRTWAGTSAIRPTVGAKLTEAGVRGIGPHDRRRKDSLRDQPRGVQPRVAGTVRGPVDPSEQGQKGHGPHPPQVVAGAQLPRPLSSAPGRPRAATAATWRSTGDSPTRNRTNSGNSRMNSRGYHHQHQHGRQKQHLVYLHLLEQPAGDDVTPLSQLPEGQPPITNRATST